MRKEYLATATTYTTATTYATTATTNPVITGITVKYTLDCLTLR